MVYSSFPIGTEVEVRSNEEGFRGAWFEAKVVGYVFKSRKYTVLFSNFVSEENPSKPLEDRVYHTFVRPRPPRSDVKIRFVKYDLVEALHKDGWWKGVVSVAPRGKGVVYRVCFPSTGEELECRREDMREQLEWVKGEWARVQDVEGDNVFDVGSRVEVSRYKKNFGAAWYTGTVLKVIGKDNLLVEYESISGSKKMPLKEIVDLQYVRPFPPPLLKFDNLMDVLEEVEVCHNGGWVAGVVSKILPGSRYVVKWKHQREEIELDQTALRPCYDWTNGHWLQINKDKSGKRKSLVVEGPNIAISASTSLVNDSEVTIKKSEEPKVEGGIETSLPSKKSKKEIPLEDDLKLTDIAKLISHKRQSDRMKSLSHRWIKWFHTGRQSKLHAQVQNSRNNDGEAANGSGIVNRGSETTSKRGESSSDGALLKGRPTLLVEQQHPGHPPQLKVGTKSAEVCHEQDTSRVNGNDLINSAEGSCFLGDASQQLSKNFGHLPVRDEAAGFLPIADLGNYKACRGLTKNTEMQKLPFDRKRNTFDVADVKLHAEERKKHKLGRPQNKKRACMNVSVEQCPEAGKENKVGRSPKKIVCINGNENEHGPEKKNKSRPKEFRNINGAESKLEEGERIVVGNEYGRQFVEPTYQTLTVDASEKEKESKNSLLAVNAEGRTAANDVTNSRVYNMQADVMENFPVTYEVDSFVQGPRSSCYPDIQQSLVLKCGNRSLGEAEARTNVSTNMVETENATIDPVLVACDHNQKVYGEARDRASIDPSPSGSSLSREDNFPDHSEHTPNRPLSEKPVIKSKKAPGDPDELTLPSQVGVLIDTVHISSSSNKTALPFTKESAMWETVESLEEFQMMPQQPHFHPLEQYEVEFREGMAIGLMVTFANLAASIQKLCITDSQDIFEEKLKALVPLELNGFNVQPVRSRLEKLIEIRINASQSESKKAYLKERILEREEEKEELDMLISAHDKLILELEKNLDHCRRKKTSMVWGINKKDSEIVQLKIDLQATEKAFFSAEEHFNTFVDAPWKSNMTVQAD